jgi:hypothetical protein
MLLDDIRRHRDDGPAGTAAARELASADLGETWHTTAAKLLADLMVNGADVAAREAATLALARIDANMATTALYRMFDQHSGSGAGHGSASRLLAHFTGTIEPSTEDLVADLPLADDFLGVLISATLGERGAAAVPAVHAALRAFPIPTRSDADHWLRDETTKYRLMYALKQARAAAAVATDTLMAVLEDGEIYRDTRHQAKASLQAIGLPETADAIAAEVRRRADLFANDEDDETEDVSLLLDVLIGMPPQALAAAHEVRPALEAVRRRFGDGVSTYEEDGEIFQYVPYEMQLANRIAEQIESES